MIRSTLARLLQNRRWRPYLIGSLASLPVTCLMLQVWKYNDGLAALLFFLCLGLLQFHVFWKTPTLPMLSTAVLLGTFVAILIAY
jgi:hypothetical protein